MLIADERLSKKNFIPGDFRRKIRSVYFVIDNRSGEAKIDVRFYLQNLCFLA